MAIDVNWKPDSFEGGKDKYDISGTLGLNNRLALNYRQMAYSPSYHSADFETSNKELNLIYKIDPHFQVYAGYSRTTGHDALSGYELTKKNVMQAGIIAMKSLNNRTTLYTLLGGGNNVANVEFGLSYQIKSNIELTSTYRHLSVEKVGSSKLKENYRGFGLGITYKI
jgi:long-subunit fatty acid transport protein